jgi:hypothetical protein
MSRNRPSPGNGDLAFRDNQDVHLIAEIMDVVRDLCRHAAVFRLLGRQAWFETLTEQCGDLLAHRARLIAELREDAASMAARRRGVEWTN